MENGWYLIRFGSGFRPVFVFLVAHGTACCATLTYKPGSKLPVCTCLQVPFRDIFGMRLEDSEIEMDKLLREHKIGGE